ncbi:TPA_asm: hypothetical protein GEV19_02960 [Listeria monocytogenes]|nr:hypothetical protein [Listeria monocytogenes]
MKRPKYGKFQGSNSEFLIWFMFNENRSKVKARNYNYIPRVPMDGEKYYYVGETNEHFTQGNVYKVVNPRPSYSDVSYSLWSVCLWEPDYFYIDMTCDEYGYTRDPDYCCNCPLSYFDEKNGVFRKY